MKEKESTAKKMGKQGKGVKKEGKELNMVKNKSKKEKDKDLSKVSKRKGFGVVNYPVGDFLIKLKNASLASIRQVENPYSKFVYSVATLLKSEGYLDEVVKKEGKLIVNLKFQNKEARISDVRLISKPGLRVYMKAFEIAKRRGPSIFILTTAKGIMTGKEAIDKKLGGEIIAEIL